MSSIIKKFEFLTLSITEEDGYLTGLDFVSKSSFQQSSLKFNNTTNALLLEAEKQLQAYFSGQLKVFDLPFKAKGTDFMQKVWAELLKIPYAQTASYKDIAQALGNKAYRAVGLANNRNPLSIFIPCHRVIGSNGKLVGYGGGLEIKEYLLNLEQKYAHI